MKKEKTAEGLSCEVIKVFKSVNIGGTNSIDLRVVKWSTGKERMLEKRHVWVKPDGSVCFRPASGLSADDVTFITEHKDEIMHVLKGEKDGNQSADAVCSVHSLE